MSLVQVGTQALSGGSTGNIHPAISSVTSGNTLLLFVSAAYDSNNVPTDSSGQTWSTAFFSAGLAGQSSVAVYVLYNANAGTHTLTYDSNSGYSTATPVEWTPLTGFDVGGTPSSNASGNPTSASCSVTTTNASDAVFSIFALGGQSGQTNANIAITTGGGWGVLGPVTQDTDTSMAAILGYQEVSSTGTFTCNYTFSADPSGQWYDCACVSFTKPSGGGSTAALSAVSSTTALGASLGATTSKAATGNGSTTSVGSVGAGVTLALTGVSATGSVGTVQTGPPVLQQVSATGTPGTAKAQVTLALTGNGSTTSVTSLGAGAVLALSAVSSASGLGVLGAAVAPTLTGASSTTSPGSVHPAFASALTGASSATSVTSVGANVTVTLSGVSSVTSVGTVRPPGLNLTPVSTTSSVGSVAPGVAHALSAVSSTSTPGSAQSTPQVPVTAVHGTGSVGTVTFGNIVVGLGGVTGIGQVGSLKPPAPLNFLDGELFMAIQSGAPPFYVGAAPVPNQRGALVLQSGTWVVPLGAHNVFLSASAGGGSPFGLAGQQVFHQWLDVAPGDTLSVTFDAQGNVTVMDGAVQLLYLFAGQPYKKRAWQSTLGQASGIQGFGSGVDAGTPFPPILVFYWN